MPELAVDASGDRIGDATAGAGAGADAAPALASSSASMGGEGGGGAPILPVECQGSGHVRTFDLSGQGALSVCPAARRGDGKKLSSAPSPAPAGAPAPAPVPTLEEHVREWADKKAASGVPARRCLLPFLTGAPKAAECRLCSKIIYAGEEVKCSVSRCQENFHLNCVVKDTPNLTAESFKCPQHGCVICKQKMFFWRCGRCTVAAHTKCAPWPVIHLKDDQGSAICWRHPSDWLLQNKNADLTNSIEEVFCRLPLPYVSEDFNIDSTIRDFAEAVYKPPPYTPIRRNLYLIKKKLTGVHVDTGCTNCRADSTCKEDCECRGLSMSCSKNCRCSELCTNKPFRKDKKIKIVKDAMETTRDETLEGKKTKPVDKVVGIHLAGSNQPTSTNTSNARIRELEKRVQDQTLWIENACRNEQELRATISSQHEEMMDLKKQVDEAKELNRRNEEQMSILKQKQETTDSLLLRLLSQSTSI